MDGIEQIIEYSPSGINDTSLLFTTATRAFGTRKVPVMEAMKQVRKH